MQPLAHVWNAVRSRSAPKQKKSKTDSSVSAKDASKTAKTETPKAGGNTGASHEMTSNRTRLADAKSSVSDLELHKVASEAFQKGDGHFSLSLKREGDKAKLLVTCDEGILRFVGLTLSKFTKDNLADN
jgi:hypothetical protein